MQGGIERHLRMIEHGLVGHVPEHQRAIACQRYQVATAIDVVAAAKYPDLCALFPG
jgi:hypothetical protein